MTEHDTPQTPADFVEAMLRSAIEADRLARQHINDRDLREAHIHTAANGLIAAMAMETLRRFAPTSAEAATGQLDQILAAGDLGGPLYRIAQGLGHDPDKWIAECDQRTTRTPRPTAP